MHGVPVEEQTTNVQNAQPVNAQNVQQNVPVVNQSHVININPDTFS